MSVIDAPDHPQAVFVGFDEDDSRLEAMQALVATSLVLEKGDLGARRPLDWDLWIQRAGDVESVPEHMHILAFCARNMGLVKTSSGGTSLFYGAKNYSPTMRIASDLPEDLDRLVRYELVPWLRSQGARPVLVVASRDPWGSGHRPITESEEGSGLLPFVFDADDNVIAGAMRRYGAFGQESWVWALPHDPPRPELWLAVALRDWHELTPDRVPAGNPWKRRAKWMTSAELSADADLDLLEERRRSWEALYAVRRRKLEAEQLQAQVDAEEGLRRLLTSHDDDLVEAVEDALRYLGYGVINEDEQRVDEGRGKAHDLSLIDPDAPNDAVIVEVKGFAKGARGALGQAQQHILRYTVAHKGRTPDRCLLVVNQFRNRDPEERPLLLQGADDDIAIFAENGGVLVDSRELFLLVRRVEDGELTQAKARAALTQAPGRFTAPAD